jgi:hypothetical protein
MPAHPVRVLHPADRTSEILFGLIMVLTFTGSLSVTEAGRAEVRTMLLGALGCNLAWGIIDAVFYLMAALAERPRLRAEDWRGALGVCLLVFLSTFPVALPFLVMDNAPRALRASNAVAVAMLFLVGAAYGRAIGRSPRIVGAGMVVLGAVLVALTIALGG